MKDYTIEEIKNQFKELGHLWPDNEVHIIGIRAHDEINDEFCDRLIVIPPNAEPIVGVGTTIPARFYLFKPMNPKGSAVLKEGQNVHSFMIGLHNGYEALIQCKPFTVYRDSNRDAIINETPGTEDTGLFNIDIHKYVSWISKALGNSSAGCQVWQDINQFNMMMDRCRAAAQKGQHLFTYTLIDEF